MATLGLLVDGAPLDPAVAASVQLVSVRQVFNAPAMAVITFADPPQSAYDIAISQPIEVRAPGGDMLLRGEITAIETTLDPGNVRTLRLRAYDRLHRLRKHQAVRALAQAGVAGLLEAAASVIDADTQVVGKAPPGRPLTVQGEESTADLLSAAAAATGRYFRLDGDVLKLMSLAGDGDTSLALVAGRNLLEARIEANAETMRSATVARGWNAARSDLIENRAGLAAQDQIEFRGSEALSAFPGLGERHLVNRFAASREEILAFAQADIDRATALAATLEATAEGDAGLRPGRVVSLRGLSPNSDGDYVLAEAEHCFDALAGYVTRVSTVPPAPPPHRGSANCATIARVTEIDDPDRLARVKARLTAFGDVETDWMPVLAIGAGEDKGISVLPEPGDDVLVLLPDGDPAHGIVLGGLYGANIPPGRRPETGARTFTIRTPAGQVLTLDGTQSLARLETRDGDVFELAPDGARLSVKRDLTIEAPGRTVTIGAAHINFETR